MHATSVHAALLVLLCAYAEPAAVFAQEPHRGQAAERGPVDGRAQRLPAEERPGPAGARDARDRPAAAGTSVVFGMITVAGTGAPARRARVMLNPVDAGGSRTVVTDENGHYAFGGLPAGRYTVSVSKTGHIGVTYGQSRPGRQGTPIQLGEGIEFAANLQLPRGGVITGSVLDEYGEPMPGIQVRVLRQVQQAGGPSWQPSGGGATDDRGIYRVYGLQPGDYLVSAVPRNPGPGMDAARLQGDLDALRQRLAADGLPQALAGKLASRAAALEAELPPREEHTTGYAPVYYPGTVSAAQATPVALGIGEERGNVDFGLQRVPLARIEGTVVNSSGVPAQNVLVTLTETAQAVGEIRRISARADAEGRFRLTNVPPGNYRLMARGAVFEPGASGADGAVTGRDGRRKGAARAGSVWGSVDLPVDGRDQGGVVVTLQPGLTVSGRVAFDTAARQPPSELTRIRISLVPAEPRVPGITQGAAGTVDEAGRFTVPGVVPGFYQFTASGAGQGWHLASAMVDGEDRLDFPFEVRPGGATPGVVVTFTDRQAHLSGIITDARGQAAPEQTLILYPADERFWAPQARRIRVTRPATDGQFAFAGLPPGDYKLAAVLDAEPGAAFDPPFLQGLDAASVRISIGDGERKIRNIQVSAAR